MRTGRDTEMRGRPARLAARLIPLAMLLLSAPALGWHTSGHHHLARAAVERLPDTVPEFFRRGAAAVGHASEDPDLWKHEATPQLRDTEGPEHFLDVELLEGRGLAPQRWDFVAALVQRGLDPERVGMLPYAIVEGTQKLTLAFAETRRWPLDETIRTKALIYAGQLAHYAGDLAQPLHTTVHYDGRAPAGNETGKFGKSPHSGIHSRVDALFDTVPFDPQAALAGLTPQTPRGDLLQAVMSRFRDSHGQVDRVYRLEPALPAVGEGGAASPQLIAFTEERFRDGVDFLAGLLLRAWVDSAAVELPGWHDRGRTESVREAAADSGDADPRARELAHRTAAAMGGRETFDGIRLLHFSWRVERGDTVVVEREHWWDRATGDYRVEMSDESGSPVVVLFNLRTRAGDVFVGDVPSDADEAEELIERAHGAFINDTYWLLMPWKWLESGVRLEWIGERSLDGKTYDVAGLTFASDIGLTSGDRYGAWVDRETGLLHQWQYVLQQEDGSPGDAAPTTWAWSDWRASGGVLFARERRQLGGEQPVTISFPVVEAIRDPSPRQLRILRELAPAVPASASGTGP